MQSMPILLGGHERLQRRGQLRRKGVRNEMMTVASFLGAAAYLAVALGVMLLIKQHPM